LFSVYSKSLTTITDNSHYFHQERYNFCLSVLVGLSCLSASRITQNVVDEF